MSRLVSAADQQNGRAGLPAAVEELLAEVVADGFTLYCCGPRHAPNALVACYEWQHYADLLTIGDFERVIAARVPRLPALDIFAPEVVVWAYEGPPQPALRALLELVHPVHPDAPTLGYSAPAGLRVSRTEQRPMTIQLPTPARVGVRGVRLSAAMRIRGCDHALGAARTTCVAGSTALTRPSPSAAGRAGRGDAGIRW